MPTSVHVLGGWQTDFAGKAPDGDLYGLLSVAVLEALDVAKVTPEEVETAHVGNLAGELFNGQAHLGGMVASVHPSFNGLPTSRHEAACASGSVAALAAMAEIEAGRYDVALVTGVEVLRNVPGQRAAELLGCASWVGKEGVDELFPWPAQFADIADEYAGRWGLDHDHLAAIAELNWSNAKRNPNAQTRDWSPIDFGQTEGNPVVRGMLRKSDCGRITDGAAAVVLASSRFASAWAKRQGVGAAAAPRITGWGHHTAPLALQDKLQAATALESSYVFPHVHDAFTDAFRRAGLADVFGLDALEVHDCFSISEYAAIDHAGITAPGRSWEAIEDGTISSGGRLPVNPSGGLIGLGHPVGATGVRMLLDAQKQVTGQAGDYQVEGASTVGTLNIGGSFTTAVTFVIAA
jgi:acetyl-CoA C-acetyltransferase